MSDKKTPTAVPPGDMTDRPDALPHELDPPPDPPSKPVVASSRRASMTAQERREEGDDLEQTVRRLVARAARHGCPLKYALSRIEGAASAIRQEADRERNRKRAPSATRSPKRPTPVSQEPETNPGHPEPQTGDVAKVAHVAIKPEPKRIEIGVGQ